MDAVFGRDPPVTVHLQYSETQLPVRVAHCFGGDEHTKEKRKLLTSDWPHPPSLTVDKTSWRTPVTGFVHLLEALPVCLYTAIKMADARLGCVRCDNSRREKEVLIPLYQHTACSSGHRGSSWSQCREGLLASPGEWRARHRRRD